MSLATGSLPSTSKQILASLSRSIPASGRVAQHARPSTALFTKLLTSDPSTADIQSALQHYSEVRQPLSQKQVGALARHLCFVKRQPEVLRDVLERPARYGGAVPVTRALARELMRGAAARAVSTEKTAKGLWRTWAVVSLRDASCQQDPALLGLVLWALDALKVQEEQAILWECLAEAVQSQKSLSDVSAQDLDTAAAWRLHLDYEPLQDILSRRSGGSFSPKVEKSLRDLQTRLDNDMQVWRAKHGTFGRRWQDYFS